LVNPLTVDPQGLGGTGAPARAKGNTGIDPGGIGGTGVQAGGAGSGNGGNGGSGGIGGTGIVGVITGFASICVNGVEVHFDRDTPVLDNGQPISARQLAVGQVVAVRAVGTGAQVSARQIALIHAAVGPVDAINPAAGEFTVLGQTARVQQTSDLAKMTVGGWVRVSGHRLAQGQIVASHIESISPQAQVQLNGLVERVDVSGATDTLLVNGTVVELGRPAPGAVPSALPQARQEVLAVGQWNGRSLVAQRVQVEPTQRGIGSVQRVVLEGFVSELGAQRLSLGRGGALSLDVDAAFTGGTRAQLAVNQRVRVSGRVGSDQQVRVDRVEFGGGHGAGSGRDGNPTEQKRSSSSSDDDKSGSNSGSGSRNSGSGSSGGDDGGSSGGSSGSGSSGSGSSGSGSSGSGSSGSGSSGSGSSGSGSSGGSSGSGSSGSSGSGSSGSGGSGSGSGSSGGSGSGSSGSGGGKK
jgi:hypothetical protein